MDVLTGIMLGASAVGGVIASLLGGADALLDALLLFMFIDLFLGLDTSLKHISSKTETGRFSSEALYRGMTKKLLIFIVIILAVYLDRLIGTYVVVGDQSFALLRSAVLLFYIFEEATSIVENLALLGVPLPRKLTNALEVLRTTYDADDHPQNIRHRSNHRNHSDRETPWDEHMVNEMEDEEDNP